MDWPRILLSFIKIGQIIFALNVRGASCQIGRTIYQLTDKLSVWCTAWPQPISPATKGTRWRDNLRGKSLAGVVAKLILAILDINRLKLNFCLRDCRQDKQRTIILFECDNHAA